LQAAAAVIPPPKKAHSTKEYWGRLMCSDHSQEGTAALPYMLKMLAVVALS
jgi:hypothetical protein